MGSIHVKLKDGQTFDYRDYHDGQRRYEVVERTYSYDVISVQASNHGVPDSRMTRQQFPISGVDDIRRL
ncbi:hypothetical protein EXE59_18950 [Nocardioides eburneiflavus]|uniref:Uncharacterized protein n=1 Tax=Nocardioides eburneiflavus TaxID=2518372 RepID=A0A4Z1CLE3_9ACTN|nr:hypothetical protein [Nocardioides eburneiflavus]TGN65800.1 hypothetical protein EXE59_18950 [Nocardioides eburneiflavus]